MTKKTSIENAERIYLDSLNEDRKVIINIIADLMEGRLLQREIAEKYGKAPSYVAVIKHRYLNDGV